MGVLAEVTVPPTHRWIPKGMTVRYLATLPDSTVTATATVDLDTITFGAESFDLEVPVDVSNEAGDTCVAAVITIRVSPKPAKES